MASNPAVTPLFHPTCGKFMIPTGATIIYTTAKARVCLDGVSGASYLVARTIVGNKRVYCP